HSLHALAFATAPFAAESALHHSLPDLLTPAHAICHKMAESRAELESSRFAPTHCEMHSLRALSFDTNAFAAESALLLSSPDLLTPAHDICYKMAESRAELESSRFARTHCEMHSLHALAFATAPFAVESALHHSLPDLLTPAHAICHKMAES